MDNNVTHSPSLHFFYFKIVAPNPGSAFYAVILSTSVVVSILSPLAVVANGLVLAAIWRNPSLRTPSYVLLAGLALTDLGTGLISQPIYVTNQLMSLLEPRVNTNDNKPTSVINAMAYGCATFFSSITISIMTVMSIERWLHMSRRSLITVRRACLIVVFLFFLPIPVIGYHVLHKMNQVATPGADATSTLIIPFLLTATSVAYFKVFRIIRRHQKQIQANEMTQRFAQPAINFAKYKKSVFSILYILVIFYMGYVPITISSRISTVLINELIVLFLNVSSVFMFLSASLNPLLYLWRMKDIRNEVKLLVKRIFHKEN